MRCSLGIDSAGVVNHYVRPRLEDILGKELSLEQMPEVRKCVAALLEPPRIKDLASLPLSLCHIDLNARNVNDILL